MAVYFRQPRRWTSNPTTPGDSPLAADARRTGKPLDTRDLERRLLADDEETTLVIGSWGYAGSGWGSPGDEALALAAAARAREYAVWRAEQSKTA